MTRRRSNWARSLRPLGQGRVTALLGGRTLRREFVVALPRRVRERLANG
jgi:hypothetical protein